MTLKRRDADDEGREMVRLATTGDALMRPASVRRSFGLPIGVSRLVDLPRAPTDREWEQLIAEFRTTFGVPGRATTSGGIRDWSQGNLRISVEPTAHGEQLRLSDLKEDAVAINGLGFGLAAMGALLGAVLGALGRPEKALAAAGVFGGMAMLAFIAANLVRTPAWARERERQMEMLAQDAVKLLSDQSTR
jgi:hypothetical protein